MDTNRQFLEKNQEIFKNKLNLEINNNSDSINLVLQSRINLKLEGLNKSIKQFLKEKQIKFEQEDLTEVFNLNKQLMREKILEELILRKDSLASFLEEEQEKIDEDYIKLYKERIDEIEKEFNKNLKNKINEATFLSLSSSLFKTITLSSEEEKEVVNGKIKFLLNDPLHDSIDEVTVYRTNILKNNLDSSYNYYLKMNKLTLKDRKKDFDFQKSLKIKQDNKSREKEKL